VVAEITAGLQHFMVVAVVVAEVIKMDQTVVQVMDILES
jgi:hypothetical protein